MIIGGVLLVTFVAGVVMGVLLGSGVWGASVFGWMMWKKRKQEDEGEVVVDGGIADGGMGESEQGEVDEAEVGAVGYALMMQDEEDGDGGGSGGGEGGE
ncbi:hypothetical protein JD969_06125 [Planctomycetota bacterium]|nr:hypothetical protein JD969_06125 [Planctomycetota bacterium]